MDSLTRSAITRAQAALDMASRSAPAPERFPLVDLVRKALGDTVELPERCHAENARWASRGRGPSRGGFVVSPDEFLTRDLTTSIASGTAQSGYLLGSSRPLLVPELGVSPVVSLAGAQTVQLEAAAALPYLSAGATAHWCSENTAPTQSATTVGLRTLTPYTLSAFIDVGHRLRLQSAFALDTILRRHLGRALARALDIAALGSGSTNGPTGIAGMNGIGSVSLGSSGALTRAKVAELVQAVTTDSGLDATSKACFIIPSAVAHKAFRTADVAQSDFLFKPESAITGRLCGWPCFVSDAAPAGTITFGDFSQLFLVNFGPLEILVDIYSGAKTGIARLTAFLDVAIQAGQPEAFSMASGVSTA